MISAVLSSGSVYGFHIIGGEIYYTCLGNNQYEVTMKIYRDPNASSGADFDEPAKLGIFKANGSQFGSIISLPLVTRNVLTGQAESPCIVTPEITIQEGIYKKVITLPPSTGGYTLVYQRCCRNATIKNIIDPAGQGATYTAFIPGPEVVDCNSSPRFKNFPPIAICADFELEFDHSATDPDGDDLRYFFCTPEQGGSETDPAPDPSAPPYTPVQFRAAYTANSPFEASPAANLDNISGLLTATPRTLGQFVVGVCVEESRNGTVISTLRRDFQFNMAACRRLKTADFLTRNSDNSLILKSVDTLLNCDDFTFNFEDISNNASNIAWDFGDPTTTDDVAINIGTPSYTYPDTGTYSVTLVIDPEDTVCSDTQTYIVQSYPGFEADFTYDTACANDALQFFDETDAAYGEVVSWNWNFGLGISTEENPFFSFRSNGVFDVRLITESNFGCTDEVIKNVSPFPTPTPDITVGNNCLDNSAEFSVATGIPIGDVDSISWFINEIDTLFGFSPKYVWLDLGEQEIEVEVISNNGCIGTDFVRTEVIDEEPFDIELDSATICEGETFSLSVDGAISYEWFPKTGVFKPFDPNVVLAPDSTTEYTLVAKGICNIDSFTSLISVLPAPFVDINPDSSRNRVGDTVFITATADPGNYQWVPEFGVLNPNSLNTDIIIGPQRLYTLQVTDEQGCIGEAVFKSLIIPSCFDLLAPNAFSPNQDGKNDVFTLFNKGGAEVSDFQIFNRWGELVYETGSIENPWNGTLQNGAQAAMGVYVWTILVNCGEDSRRVKGNITLLR